eukprot:COSAG01_NODE_17941_length_1112_cov_14.019743_2_plen_55_part_01
MKQQWRRPARAAAVHHMCVRDTVANGLDTTMRQPSCQKGVATGAGGGGPGEGAAP